MVKKAAPKNPAAKKPAAKKLEIDNSVAEMAVEAPRRGRRPNAVSEEIPVSKESVSIKKNKKAGNPKTKAIELVPEKEPIEEEQPNQLVLQNSSLVDVPQPESHQLHSQVLKEVGADGLPIV
ncbi:histone H1-II-like [Spinacia oleracea]|uniref:Histone H1-II-like n=1 Tax=Spinacia oleracea TaxID=3562 RepID=A0ABM3R4R6_SPIOL|nr:histone H1-II-like [Spinacia oleracea]